MSSPVTFIIKEYGHAPFKPNQPQWNEIFQLCEAGGDTEWYIVEQGGPSGIGFDVPRKCLNDLRTMGK